MTDQEAAILRELTDEIAALRAQVTAWREETVRGEIAVGRKFDAIEKRVNSLEQVGDVQRGILLVSRHILAGVGAVVLIVLTVLANAAWQWISNATGWGR